jgi:HEAT repeat protein
MSAVFQSRSSRRVPVVLAFAIRALVLLLPAGLLLVGVTRATGHSQTMFALGAIFQLLVCLLAFLSFRSWHRPVSPSVITMYSIALCWLWLGMYEAADWYLHLAQAILLVVPLTVFAVQTLTYSGAPAIRRASLLADRLANQEDWPADLFACRTLPEVKAFREALHLDATPALNLLQHPRLPVRVAAMAALEFRKSWRLGQAELVFQIAQTAQEPALRAAGITALANLDDRVQVEVLADFLQDPSWQVRRAAIEALLWDSGRRWSWIRHAVRQTLANPAHKEDGPLQYTGQLLTDEAVTDLKGWAAEKNVLGLRAAQSLGLHYSRVLHEQPDEALVRELERQLTNPHSSAILRLELAQTLYGCGRMDARLQESLLDPANPASLRLLAAEALLTAGRHPQAIATLHDIARLPNREIALATADVAQRCLGVDLGLEAGQPLPRVHTRQAAEVTRRVMLWATHQLGGGQMVSEEWGVV